MSMLGNRVVRVEDRKFLTVGGTYMADLREPALDGAVWATFVRSTEPHATVRSIDVGAARDAAGVVAVFTAADIDLAPPPPSLPMFKATMARPWLATDRVRFVGEPVAVVLTEEPYQGADAVELVWVDYDPLPAVVDVEDAARDEVLLFPDAGTNSAATLMFGHSDDFFAGCEVVVTERLVNQRLAACPLEGRGAAAAWDGGRLTFWVSTQGVQSVRDSLHRLYGIDEADIRVIAPDVGGGFGPKIGAHTEDLLVPWLASRVGRPVRWVETRTENLTAMGHGRGQVQVVEIGGSRDGTIEAYRLTVRQDAGAYPGWGAFLPYLTRVMASGTYAIPRVECNTTSVVTNTMTVSAYRGAGRPEATAAIERAVDLFAAAIECDPVDVRRKNLVPADAFPFTTPTGTVYDSGDYEAALDRALDAAGYPGLRAEQARRRADANADVDADVDASRLAPVELGIGVALYVEVTGGPTPGSEEARIEVAPDGSVVVYTGTSPHGQGHGTAWAMIASNALGIPLAQVRVVHGDTDAVPKGGGTSGSRSLQLGGMAVYEAANVLVGRARGLMAEWAGVGIDDVTFDVAAGRFALAGSPEVARSWADLADEAVVRGGDGLSGEATFKAPAPTFPFGCHVAVVEVDSATGLVRLRRLIAVDDAGRILNPLLAEGQRHGGIAQGVAQALYEEMRYDDEGNPVTANLADYAMVSAPELPSFELVAMETTTPVNALGVKGIGESGTIGATPAVQNAVVDALSPVGIRHIDMPCTPERVWRAIEAARTTSNSRQ